MPTFILHGLWKPHLSECSWEGMGGGAVDHSACLFEAKKVFCLGVKACTIITP